jgi:hypothetical protein
MLKRGADMIQPDTNRNVTVARAPRVRLAKTAEGSHRRFVLKSNPVPFRITEANAENIRPQSGALTNANPHFDPAQRTFEKREAGRRRDPFTVKLAQFGRAIFGARDRHKKLNREISPLRVDIEETAIEAAGEWIANTSDPECVIEYWLALAPIKDWPRAIYRAAHRAVDRLLRHFARSYADETAYLNLCDETFTDANGDSFDLFATDAEKLAFIKRRCVELRAKAEDQLREATNNKQRGFIKSVVRMIDRGEAYAMASVRSERFAFRTPLTFTADGMGKVETRAALQQRALRLNRFLGLIAA